MPEDRVQVWGFAARLSKRCTIL